MFAKLLITETIDCLGGVFMKKLEFKRIILFL